MSLITSIVVLTDICRYKKCNQVLISSAKLIDGRESELRKWHTMTIRRDSRKRNFIYILYGLMSMMLVFHSLCALLLDNFHIRSQWERRNAITFSGGTSKVSRVSKEDLVLSVCLKNQLTTESICHDKQTWYQHEWFVFVVSCMQTHEVVRR